MMFGHVETIEDRAEHLQADSRSTGSQRRVYCVYLLDLSTAAYGIEK